MKKLYLITGGTGHLGQHVIRLLRKNKDCSIRVLTLPGDRTPLPAGVERVNGDVCTASSLSPFFDTGGYDEVVLFHLAALITIASKANPKVWNVNVEGTRNVMNMAMNANIGRVVYVSTVHAIPEKPLPGVITEMASFSPDSVDGQYAKSKAVAAELVLQFAKCGLNVSIVHPSGILGPGDALKSNHLTRTVAAMASGRIPVSIAGGYDFVDVRDVAKGILQCETRGKAGECYILSGHYSTVSNLTKDHLRVHGPPIPAPAYSEVHPQIGGGFRGTVLQNLPPQAAVYAVFPGHIADQRLFQQQKGDARIGIQNAAVPPDDPERAALAGLREKGQDDRITRNAACPYGFVKRTRRQTAGCVFMII